MCSILFKDYAEENLRVHMSKCGYTGNWKCNFCDYASRLTTNVTRHIEGKHVKVSTYSCEICYKECSTRHALKCHKYRYHPPTQ